MKKAEIMIHILENAEDSGKSIHDRFLEEFDIKEALEIIKELSPDSGTIPEMFAGTMDELNELKIRL